MSDPEEVSIEITDRARRVLTEIERERESNVALVLNDGCCDGMGPVAVEADTVGVSDVLIGETRDIKVYAPLIRENARTGYELAIDVVESEGVGSFSLEVSLGYRLTVVERRQ
ncbi:hypothetical protein HAPAU_35420 [Halalkalicoccus paucihalophilus]|uniref:DUF779 domain-containing protein n=1 Tax=Halalkalicoccus paucihalophilus TaxID=1008153 RepID=A0A151AAB1_9EURY|nr:DUF779 domain-containing protein [Halalkalicoccus paucihalophilus]KYH24559.1 hypothetical protein HAPAU_35420 [Halalkalicoccus paucihalophilus]